MATANPKMQLKPQTGRAAVYVRVSTFDQGERYSLPSQLKALREKAARDGKHVPDEWVFVDTHTGKSSSRPGFDRLKSLVKTGAPDAAYIYDVSRFARKTMDSLWLAAEFKRHGVKLDFVEMPYEDTPTGRLTFTQMAAVAEFLGEKIIEDSKRGRREKLEQGLLDHGSACDGFTYIPKKNKDGGGTLVINPERAPIWEDIFRWRGVDHMASYAICKRLNDAGILTATGKLWHPRAIRKGLANTTYIGQHQRAGIIVPCPSIKVSKELFDACQNFTEESRRKDIGRPSNQYLLRKFIWCAKCLKRMITNPGVQGGHGRRHPYYRCGNIEYTPYRRRCDAGQVYQDHIEPEAWKAIWSLLKDPDLLLKLAQAYYDKLNKPKAKTKGLAGVEKERAELQAKIETTRHMIQDSLIKYATGRADIRKFEARIQQIDQELAAAGRVMGLPPKHQVEALLREITNGPEPETYEERRPILEGIRDLRMVYGDEERELTIEGKIPISGPVESTGYGEKKWAKGLDPGPISFPAIPFILKRRVA